MIDILTFSLIGREYIANILRGEILKLKNIQINFLGGDITKIQEEKVFE